MPGEDTAAAMLPIPQVDLLFRCVHLATCYAVASPSLTLRPGDNFRAYCILSLYIPAVVSGQ